MPHHRSVSLFKLAPIAALLAGSSPAFAQTLIDASTDLPWPAPGFVVTSGEVLITGTKTLSGAALSFDTPRSWSIINNGQIISEGNGSTLFVSNFSGVDIVNNGSLEKRGTVNVDTLYLTTGDTTANINVTNNGYIHSEYSNSIESHGGNVVTIINNKDGVIQADGTRFAVYASEFSGTASITNDGLIDAPSTYAVTLMPPSKNMMTIINNGTVVGGWFYGQEDGGIGHNYTLLNNGVINPGITASSVGIRFIDRVDTVSFTNNGTMTAAAYGFYLPQLVGTASIINNGTIQGQGGGYRGIGITALAGASAITITNTGTIQGQSSGIGIVTDDPATRTDITNTGTITGDNGTAILLGSGVNTLTLDTGSVLNGNVNGSAGASDAVFLKGTGTEDSQFIAIETLAMQGSDWTLSGALEFSNSVTVESGTLRLNTGSLTSAQTRVQSGAILDTSAGNYAISGNLDNAGTVRIGQSGASPGNTLTVSSYTGNGGVVALNTTLGDDGSATDKLIVTGDTSGHSSLQITNAGGSGAQTLNGIQVVQVQGQSDGMFSLAAPVQADAYQYALTRGNAQDAGNWYLVSAATPDGKPVYRPAISGYIAGQRIDADLGFQQLSSLHQRIGDHRALPSTLQSWARVWHSRTRERGRSAFGHETTSSGLQLGQEVFTSANASGGLSRVAISLDYANTDADFSDHRRGLAGLGRDSGSLEARSLALGGYFTYAFQGGSYLDVTGQVATLRNRFRDTYGEHSTQTGWRGGLSVEAGSPIGVLSGWTFEPQFQLAYHAAQYRNFDDGVSRIGSYTADALRARLGVRVFRDLASAPERKLHVYGIANIIGDLLDPDSVKVGDTKIQERYGKTWGELGFGVQGGLSKSTTLFGELRVQQGFAGKDEKREGGSLNIGLRYSF